MHNEVVPGSSTGGKMSDDTRDRCYLAAGRVPSRFWLCVAIACGCLCGKVNVELIVGMNSLNQVIDFQ